MFVCAGFSNILLKIYITKVIVFLWTLRCHTASTCVLMYFPQFLAWRGKSDSPKRRPENTRTLRHVDGKTWTRTSRRSKSCYHVEIWCGKTGWWKVLHIQRAICEMTLWSVLFWLLYCLYLPSFSEIHCKKLTIDYLFIHLSIVFYSFI